MSIQEDDARIGQRIRVLRLRQNLTLTELARRVGISKSLLSQVERGSSNASVAVLRSIARELGTPFFTLFVETDLGSGLIRKAERRQLSVPGSPITRELLVPDLHRNMVVVVARLAPGEISSPENPTAHQGEEFVLVVSGQIEVEIDGQILTLDEGDSLYFDPLVSHRMRNSFEGTSEVLAIMSGNPRIP